MHWLFPWKRVNLLVVDILENIPKIFNELRKCKIGVNVHYIPVVSHPFYRKLGFNIKKFPRSLAFYKNSMSIPIYPNLKIQQQLKIIKCIKKLV